MVPYPKEISQAVLSGLDLSVIFYHHHEKNLDNAKMFSIEDQKGYYVQNGLRKPKWLDPHSETCF